MNKLRIGIYVRVSRRGDREDDRFHSPREQAERASVLAVAKGYTPGPVFEDIDVSGATAPADRPAMRRLLKAIQAGELGGVAAYSLDRLSREPAHGDALVKVVTKSGGVILTPDIPEAIDSPTGEFTFGMLMQVAKLYRSQAAARFASAKENAIASGIPVTNRDAVGYRRNAERRYEPDPDVAPVIRQVFERRAAGAGPTELAEFLESQGVKTSQGSRTWSKAAVQNLIKSRTYLGELRSGDSYVNPAAHEPIVDLATWTAAQHPNPAPRRARSSAYLLSGILRCKACGYCMQGTHSSRGKRIYRCARRHAGGICPEPARIEADAVESLVIAEIRGTMVERRGADVARVDPALEEELKAAERRLEQALSPEVQDALGDGWPAFTKARREERDAAALEFGKASANARTAGNFWDNYRKFDPDTATPEEIREVITGLFLYIAVDREKAIHWPPDDDDTQAPAVLSRRGYNREAKLNPL